MAGTFDNLLYLLSEANPAFAPLMGNGNASTPSRKESPMSAGSAAIIPSADDEWMALLQEAHRQRVMGLVADAVAELAEERKPSLRIRARLALETEVIERMNRAVNDAAAKLITIYGAAGLHPVIQKGPSVASMYPDPLHRECGDIDIFFSPNPDERTDSSKTAKLSIRDDSSTTALDDFSRSREIALTLCGRPATETDDAYNRAVDETDDARNRITDESDGAFHYRYGGVLVEHHPLFYDSACQFPQFDVQSPEARMIMLSTHILKHVLGKGIGLKQICDYFVAREKLDYDKAAVAHAMEEAGLAKWQYLLDGFGPDLRRIVERSGNFGRGKDNVRETKGRHSRLSTARSFLRSIPFALKYAPREWFHTVSILVRR